MFDVLFLMFFGYKDNKCFEIKKHPDEKMSGCRINCLVCPLFKDKKGVVFCYNMCFYERTRILANFRSSVFSPKVSNLTLIRALSGVPSMRMTEPSPNRS